MRPFGQALLAYLEGDSEAELTLRRDDGLEVALPAGFFFRAPEEFSEIERLALELCRGHVLDIGAGSGLHALALQERGLRVTAIDLSPEAVDVMIRRGVRDVIEVDLFRFRGGPFDTLLLLGHGIGMVEDLDGLATFLTRAKALCAAGGHLLVHSTDVRCTEDPVHLAYQERNRRAGRYIGEIRLEVEFQGLRGSRYGWLHVDPETLEDVARDTGWESEILHREETGDYLARLTRAAPTV